MRFSPREPIHQANGAVVLEMKLPGQLADLGVVASRKTLDRQQRLMLLRRQAGVARRFLAEREKAAERVAQHGERFVVRLGDASGAGHGSE